MIVGLNGKARHGKGTVAKILVDDYGFIEHSFAAVLKEILLEERIVDEDDEEHRTPHWRSSAIAVGAMARHLFDDYWILELASNPEFIRDLDNGANIVISDVRYRNELSWIKDCGGYMIRVIRVNENDIPLSFLTDAQAASPSETDTDEIGVGPGLDQVWRIPDGNIKQIKRKVDAWMHQMGLLIAPTRQSLQS